MAGGTKFGYKETNSKQTGRTGTATQFPKQFVSDLHNTLGGPFTTNDLFRLMPKPRSLFGYAPTQAEGPGGSFTLGFGPPKPGAGLNTQTPAAEDEDTGPVVVNGVTGQVARRHNKRPDTADELAADAAARAGLGGGLGSGPQTPAATFSLSDLEDAYFNDPEKVMDLPRLLDKAGLDPQGFTYDQLAGAVDKAKKYGFSGRSRGNFARVLAGLQRDTTLEDTFEGGKGTGIF